MDKELVSVLECVKETEKAYLLKMFGCNRINGEKFEVDLWWPKSQVTYTQGDKEIEVSKWLLDKKLEEKFGPETLVEIY